MRVALLTYAPSPHFFSNPCPISFPLRVPSQALRANDLFSSSFPAVAFFPANPLALGRQYYFTAYLAHHLSGRAVRLTPSDGGTINNCKKHILIFLTYGFGFKNEILQLWNFFFFFGAGRGAGIEKGNKKRTK